MSKIHIFVTGLFDEPETNPINKIIADILNTVSSYSSNELQEDKETKSIRDNTDELKNLKVQIEESLKKIPDDDVFIEFNSWLSKNNKEAFDTLLGLSYVVDKGKLESAKKAIDEGVKVSTEHLIEKLENEIDEKFDRINYLKDTYLNY